MKLDIQERSGRKLFQVAVEPEETVLRLKEKIQTHIPKAEPYRQRLSLPRTSQSKGTVLEDEKSLKSYGLREGDVVYYRDLGFQISWKMVFILEYLGPMIIVPILALQPSFLYHSEKLLRREQKIAVLAWTGHYFKRELETLFIHRFSHATMPLLNLFKNCSYYWGFAAAIGYFLCHRRYTPVPMPLFFIGFGIFVLSEISNLITHWMLRQLRPPGTQVRRIPYGFLFEWVSCPNYTTEITAWFGFNLMTNVLLGWVFMIVGAIQMTLWAKKKHRQYLAEFNGQNGRPMYPKKRRIIFPGVF